MSAPTTISKTMQRPLTERALRSPAKTPSISSSIAPQARTISGSIGISAWISVNWFIASRSPELTFAAMTCAFISDPSMDAVLTPIALL